MKKARLRPMPCYRKTQRKMCRRSRQLAMVAGQIGGCGYIVLVKNKVPMAGPCKKMNLRWWGPFKGPNNVAEKRRMDNVSSGVMP